MSLGGAYAGREGEVLWLPFLRRGFGLGNRGSSFWGGKNRDVILLASLGRYFRKTLVRGVYSVSERYVRDFHFLVMV